MNDHFRPSAGAEGDPITLARRRTSNFWNRKVVLTSTPTIKGSWRIEAAFAASDQRRFYVPCHACRHEQVLRWSQVAWDKDADENHLPATARYTCERCGAGWNDAERNAAVKRGTWRASALFTGTAGFHLSGIYSPWVKITEMMTQFLEARDYPEQLKAFVNLSLGETWEEKGEQLEQGSIAARRESYGPELPANVCVVTAGVDVQDDRLEVEFVGWGIGEESWGLEYRTIRGDPSTGTPWRDLDALLLERRARVDGVALPVAAACIESGGHFSQAVYAFARERYGRRVFATKGMGSRSCCSGRHEDHDGATRRDAACARWDFCCRAMSRRNRAMKKRPRGGAPLRKARSHQRGWPLLFAPRPSRKLNTVTG